MRTMPREAHTRAAASHIHLAAHDLAKLLKSCANGHLVTLARQVAKLQHAVESFGSRRYLSMLEYGGADDAGIEITHDTKSTLEALILARSPRLLVHARHVPKERLQMCILRKCLDHHTNTHRARVAVAGREPAVREDCYAPVGATEQLYRLLRTQQRPLL